MVSKSFCMSFHVFFLVGGFIVFDWVIIVVL